MLVSTNISVKVFARSLHIVGGGRAGSNKDEYSPNASRKYEYHEIIENHYSQRKRPRST